MIDLIASYFLFLLKVITGVIAIMIVLAASMKNKSKEKDNIKIPVTFKLLNEKFDELKEQAYKTVFDKKTYKSYLKTKKKENKLNPLDQRPKAFVIQFKGDIKASAVKSLRQEITAILMIATPQDEVILLLESYGGSVHPYGLAASQLMRLRDHSIPLTVIIDNVAASGGYLMASVGQKILAAPFAIIGSIGVVAQLPNFHDLLKKNHIDYAQITAGNFKRTLNVFAKNTPEGMEKAKESVELTHTLFKNFVKKNRPQLPIDKVSTGEYWHATHALSYQLIDALSTSDDYLVKTSHSKAVYKVTCKSKKRPFWLKQFSRTGFGTIMHWLEMSSLGKQGNSSPH